MARVELLAIVVVLSGCPDSTKGPVSVPDQLVGFQVKDCYEFRPEVFQGPVAPIVATNIVARCEDARVCTTEIEDNGDIFIYGEAPGATSLFVAFDHPTTHNHEEHHIRVVFERTPAGGDWLHPRVQGSQPTCPPRRSAPLASSAPIASDAAAP